MSTYRLEKLLNPGSIAVVGGSLREKSLGRAVLRNLRTAGFTGSISLVNSRYPAIDGNISVKALADLTSPPDLVVICVPPVSVPSVVAEAGFKSFSSLYVDMPRSHQEQPGYRDIGASAGELPIVTRLTGLQRRTFWALGGLAIRFR